MGGRKNSGANDEHSPLVTEEAEEEEKGPLQSGRGVS